MENTQLPQDFKDFLALLNANDVHYLLIGGYAVGYYGMGILVRRTTWTFGSLPILRMLRRWLT